MVAISPVLPLGRRAPVKQTTGGTRKLAARLFLLSAFIVILGMSCTAGTKTLDEQAQAIFPLLMCPVCPSETIDQSQTQIAREMRDIVRQKLAEGQTQQQILDYFSAPERYGIGILAAPPASGFNTLVWVFPPILLLGAAAGFYFILKSMRQRRPVVIASDMSASSPEDDLAPYFSLIDTEYEMSQYSKTNQDPSVESDLARDADRDVKA